MNKTVLALLVGISLLAAACSSDADQSSSEDTLTVYSERSKDLIDPLIDLYIEETGQDVEIRYDEDIVSLITEEGDKSPADVFLSKAPGSLGFIEQADLLTPLEEDTLNLVDANVRDTDGLWVGISGRQRVLVYNSELVDTADLPSTVAELTQEQWKGKVGVAPNNGSFRDFVTAMRTSIGDDDTQAWLEALAANEPITYPKNGPIVDAVGAGEVEVGLVNHYYNFRELQENAEHLGLNHNFDAADPGSFLLVSAATKLASTDNNDAADTFIAWLLGEEAQTYLATETFEYPLATGVDPVDGVANVDFANSNDIDYQKLGTGAEKTQEMISGAGLSE